jgi:transcriptional regulator with XRE-family HTH domain
MTQERLADRGGLSADTIRRLEHGSFSPSLDTLTKLCTGLQISRSTLFESFELGERDHTRELVDLLALRTRHEVEIATNMVRTLLDGIDGIEPMPDDPEEDEAAVVVVPDLPDES